MTTEATHDELVVTRTPHVQASPKAAHALLSAVALIGLLAVGAYLRLVGLDWDENQHLHPDERFLTQVESAITPVETLADYFDTPNSSLNPNNRGHGFFVYGDFPIILVRYVGEWQGMIAYHNVYLVGRALSAGFDLMTILLIFLIGRRLYDYRIGLLGAGLYAVAALPIQQAHFFTVDSFTNTFVAAAFLFAVRALDDHRWPDFVFFGLTLGLAMASKVTVFPLAGTLMLALGLRLLPQLRLDHTWEVLWDDPPSRAKIIRTGAGLALAGLVTVLTFRVAMPYAFLPPGFGTNPESILSRALEPLGFAPNPLWLDQMRDVRFQVSGQADIPPNHQWANRPALVFPWLNMVRFGMGWPLGITAWLGLAWAIWEIARRHRGWREHLLPVTWIAFFFAWQGIGWVKTMRYFLPVYPFLTLLAAWALVTLWDRVNVYLRARRVSTGHWSATVSGGLLIGVTLASAAWGFAFSRIYTRPVTRMAASDWVYENVPSNITFTIETENGPRLFQYGLLNSWRPLDANFDEYLAPEARYTSVAPEASVNAIFKPPYSGTVTGLTFNHIADPNDDADVETLRVTVSGGKGDERMLDARVSDSFQPNPDEPRGRSYEVEIEPFEVEAGESYTLTLSATSGRLILAGSSLALEGDWDDPLPFPMEDYNPWAKQLHGYLMQMAWEDTPDKRERWQYILDRSDYLVITSNRFYDSLSRIPSRWPMTMDYYEALFNGDLGFELVGDFTSYPNLGPVRFPDQSADEAFTVYDHPRVHIFRKTDDYSSANTAQILRQADLDEIVRVRADMTNEAPVKLEPPSLPRQGRQNTMTAPGFNRSNLLNTAQPLAVVVWWLAIIGAGWLAFPVLFVAFPGLPDRAYPLAKTFGLLFVAWLGWLLASVGVLSWTRVTLLVSVAVLAALSGALASRSRRELVAFVRANRKHLLTVEGLTFALFLYFLLVRLGNPDLWHPAYGGEKPMDFAYFNAVLKSNTFPPYDPWFAGGTINYYYFGFVLVGAPVKLLGVIPSLAYNLILPTLYALTGMGAFTAAFSLVAPSGKSESPNAKAKMRRAYVGGMAALLMAVFLGNLDQIRTLLFALAEVSGFDPGYGYQLLPPLGAVIDGLAIQLARGGLLPVGTGEWYWNATRLIPVPLNEAGISIEPGPITEFPYFTFLYADLHAHMIAMPLSLLCLTWAIAQVRNAQQRREYSATNTDRSYIGAQISEFGFWILNFFIGGLAIGALRPTNTWDYPTYLLLGVAALAMAQIIRRARFDLLTLPDILWRGALLVGLTFLLFLPYLRSYEAGYNTLDPWEGSHTPLWAYLDVHGLFLFVLATFLIWETHAWLASSSHESLNRWRSWLRLLAAFILIVIAIAVYLTTKDYPTAALVVLTSLWSLILFFRPGLPAEKRIVFALLALSVALSLFVEVYVLRGDIGRMNTVFKFYLQVWLLLSVAAGAALAWMWPHLTGWRPPLRTFWLGGLGVLVFLAVLYPVTATGAKVTDRWSPDAPNTLDGMAYMPYATRHEMGQSFSLAPDYEALRWLQDNVEGTPIVLEANTVEYRWGSRVSIYTGLPSVIGWNWHQRQQRSLQSLEVSARVTDVATLYGTLDAGVAMQLLDDYDVEYIIVGDLERAYFEPSGLDKFAQMAEDGDLRVVYDEKGTVIYQVASY
jgi:YYY domain-containing protein